MIIFTRSCPNHIVIIGVHGQASHGIGTVLIKYRLKGVAVIFCFPDMTAGNGNIIFTMITWIYGKVGNTARGKCRPYTAEFESF